MTAKTQDALRSFEERPAPPLGGFNRTFLSIEIRRLLRNRRTIVVTLVVPIALFLLLSSNKRIAAAGLQLGPETTMIGIAVYGAMLASTSGGAMVSIERALGWSRQLRLTPLRPAAYIAIKLLTAMLLGLASVLVVYALGAITGVHLAPAVWLATALLAWVGSFLFASFGLFMGYLLPSENVMQIISPILAFFALFGGLFVPLSIMPQAMQDLAPFMPTYGIAQIARYPLLGGSFDPVWVVSLAFWTALFAGSAMFLFRRDTRRT